jgi:hypothetical protein
VYIRGLVLPLFCLSFFPPYATSCISIQYNYISLYLCSPVFPSSAQPSRPACPRPHLAKPSHLRPHRAKSRPSRTTVGIMKSRIFHRALPLQRVAAPSTSVTAPEFPSTPPRVPWTPFPFPTHPLHYVASNINSPPNSPPCLNPHPPNHPLRPLSS